MIRLFTYILKDNSEIAGYFELLFNKQSKEAEIAYFGILEEYFGKKLGGYLLSEAIKCSFNMGGWESLGSYLFARSQKCIKKLFG